ncbi:MAG TPA: pitrilysin family protein [Pirellulaceae bacterium]
MRRLHLLSSCLVVFASLLLSMAPAAEPRKITAVEGITEYQLENGLKLLLFPDLSQPKVTVNLTILTGSRHEGYGETGMAHLLEHLVFKGTPTFKNIPEILKERGARFNGTTWVDRTNYYETLTASDDNLEFGIRFEADRMVNSFIRREDLISEMTVVRNEFESGENDPEQLLSKHLLATAYEWHNYGKDTIGNRTDIERVPIDRLQAFYKKYYQPDNAVLIVAGKFDETKALEYVQKYFGAIPRPERKLAGTYTEEPPQDGERVINLRRVGDLGIVEPVWHICAGSHEDFAPLQMLASVLTTQPAGRLYKALVETKEASSVNAAAYNWHDPGLFDITVKVRREKSTGDAEKTMNRVVDELLAKGVTNEEVQRAKQQYLNNRRQQAIDTSRLAVTLSDWVAIGDWRLYFLHRDRVEKVTAADVQRVAAKYLKTTNRTVGYFIPTDKPDLVKVPENPDISKLVADYKGRPPIAAAEEFDFNYPNIETRTTRSKLSTGIQVAVLPKKSRDEEVDLSLTLRYGNADNLKPMHNAAEFLPSLMMRGTKKLSYQQLRDALTKIESELRLSGGTGSLSVSLRSKKPHLTAALDLLKQVLREPLLDPKEMEIIRQSRLAQAEAQLTEPASRASELLHRTLSPYPSDDVRYYTTSEEDIQRTKAVTLDQVRHVYEDYLAATNGELVIVGDFDPQTTLKTLEDTLAGWKSNQSYAYIERKVFADIGGSKHSVNTPDKANAVYRAGLEFAMNDRDPDYPALVLGNYVLGGGSLSSRLGDRVRQKDGLSYGVGSGLNAGIADKYGSFSVFAICNPDVIGKVDTAVIEEIQRLLKDGIPADELAKAKQGWLQSQQLARSTDTGVASKLQRGLRVNQTLTYDADLETKVAALTPSDVLAALKKYLQPQRLVIVTAGDFAKKNAE